MLLEEVCKLFDAVKLERLRLGMKVKMLEFWLEVKFDSETVLRAGAWQSK